MGFLREEIVYSSKSYYYTAIIEDLVLRFSWSISLLLSQTGYSQYSELTTSVFATLEVVRRFIWNFFRLENEHLNNCGKFRAVRDISVAPLDASDQQQIIKLMDETDPASVFRKKKLFKSPTPVVDPQKVPLLGEPEKKEKGTAGSLGLKTFHLGANRRKKTDAGKLEENLQKKLLDLSQHDDSSHE